MLNAESIRAVEAARYAGEWVRPLYESYNWARLPMTITQLFTGVDIGAGLPMAAYGDLPLGRIEQVITLFIDGFGWRFLAERIERYPFLKRLVEQGVLNQSTAMFPSTTTGHTTALYKGLTPIQSGFYEWYQYEPGLDKIICPLMFNNPGERQHDTLKGSGIDPATLYSGQTTWERLHNEHNVSVYTYQPREYAFSVFSNNAMRGGKQSGYRTIAEALTNIVEKATRRHDGRRLHALYIDTFDGVMHSYGPGSRQAEAEIDTILTQLERILHAGLIGKVRDTVVLLIADHGQVGIEPEKMRYIDDLPDVHADLTPLLAHTREETPKPLVPAGSPRDLFLHVQPEYLDTAHGWLEGKLADFARVLKTADLIAAGFFGPGAPSEKFLARVGNLVVLPYGNDTVWWHGAHKPRGDLLGLHGGLHPDEMITPIGFMPYPG